MEAPVAVHHVFARALEADARLGRPMTARRGREWLDVASRWRHDGHGPRWLLAETHRTDIAVFDPVSRRVRGEYGWTFDAARYIGGTRPGPVAWHELAERPGWMLGEGWALTPELSGIASRDQAGLAQGAIEASIRRRSERAVAILGGRHLGAGGDARVRLDVALDGQPIDSWIAAPGPFLRVIELAGGRLAGDGYATLAVAATAEGGGALPPVAVEQFDVQSEGTAVWAFADGWHEAEYDRRTRRSFRWAGRRADLRILNAAGDIELVLEVDAPAKYFAEAPTVEVSTGDRVLRRERVGDAFSWRLRVPRDVLANSAHIVTITTDRTFTPSDAGVADARELALRFFTVAVSR
jgi:hypothetical protein